MKELEAGKICVTINIIFFTFHGILLRMKLARGVSCMEEKMYAYRILLEISETRDSLRNLRVDGRITFFFYLVCEVISTAARSWPIVPASDDSEGDCGEADGM
jgi:hypothetical protein